MRSTRAGSLLVAVLALGGVVAAAGPASAARHPSGHAAAVALAHRELLTASSYPKGWKGQGKDSTDPQASFFGGADSADVTAMTGCLGTSATNAVTNPTEATGQEYADPNSTTTVSDSVEVYPSTTDAATDVAEAGNAKAGSCVQSLEGSNITQGILQGFGKGAKADGPLTVTVVTLPRYGSSDAMEQWVLPVTYQGETGSTYTDYLFVQSGRSESVLQALSEGTPPSMSVLDHLLAEAASRMKSS